MRRDARGLLALLVAAVVVAGGVLLAHRSGGGRPPVEPTGASTAPVTAVATRLAGPVRLSAAGTTLVVDLPLRTDAAVAVTVAPVRVPARFHAGTAAVRVAAGGSATLRLRWDGPDCERDVPDRILTDLALTVRAPPRTLRSTLDTSAADALLRQSWVTGCGIEPTPDGSG